LRPDARVGVAAAKHIDRRMAQGGARPAYPLGVADLIELDMTMAVAQSLDEELKEPPSAASALLSRMVDGDPLGRETRRGFCDYVR
jgi:3-hydroxybutyryl-CoA dehydrogenase